LRHSRLRRGKQHFDKLPKAAPPSRLIGYARVSTEEQGTDPQLDELRAAGCATVLEEHASGADRSGPVLARLLHEIRPGETLVVVRLDRLARSVSHLLAVIEQLEAAGAEEWSFSLTREYFRKDALSTFGEGTARRHLKFRDQNPPKTRRAHAH
jgi:DNA invertase Pin-like site-specific DNA recombinase